MFIKGCFCNKNKKIEQSKKDEKEENKTKEELSKRQKLFKKQLVTFTKAINQVANIVKKNFNGNIAAYAIICQLERLLSLMRQVYWMS